MTLRPWHWALVLVTSIHLLTTAGTWLVTDHGEMLYVARRLLHRGTLELWQPGEPVDRFLSWPGLGGEQPVRSRFVPATSLTLLPLLALDEALGLGDREQFGRLVHLQGHLFVLGALALLGWSVRRAGGSDMAAAVAVILSGLAWPVWMVARRVGPEPLLLFLATAFAASRVAPRGGRLLGAAICGLLPWCHSTGPVLSAALLAATVLEEAAAAAGPWPGRAFRAARACWPQLAFGAIGVATLIGIWNLGYHHDWWLGGYAPYYEGRRAFGALNPLDGLADYGLVLLLQGPLLLLPAVAGARRRGGLARAGLSLPAVVTLVLLLVFATFHKPEPERRLAVVLPLWGVLAGCVYDRLGWPALPRQALTVMALPLGLFWLVSSEQGIYLAHLGVFVPEILWLRLGLQGRLFELWPVSILLAALLLAAARLGSALRTPLAAASG